MANIFHYRKSSGTGSYKEQGKWFYDTSILLGNIAMKATVFYPDERKVDFGYEEQPTNPIETFGSAEGEDSVYSKKNNKLNFKVQWEEGAKTYFGEAEYKLVPEY